MPLLPLALVDLHAHCAAWSDPIGELEGDEPKIAYVQQRLPDLLKNRPLMTTLREGLQGKGDRPERRDHMLFDNEWLLHMDARGRFSVRLYVYGPGEKTFVHDHSSWGVLGAAVGEMEVVKYRRKDDGQKRGYALLAETERIVCGPGRTDFTLPLDEGIHRVGNPTDQTIAIINVYGRPARRLYIHRFDIENNRVFKVFPPRLRKKAPAAPVDSKGTP